LIENPIPICLRQANDLLAFDDRESFLQCGLLQKLVEGRARQFDRMC